MANMTKVDRSRSGLFVIILICGFFLIALFSLIRWSGKSEKGPDLVYGCTTSDITGNISLSDKTAYFEGKTIRVPVIAMEQSESNVLGVATEERWVEVDLSEQMLYAWEGDNLFLKTPVSTGLAWWPTPTGEFHIWAKLRATTMEGGEGNYYYNLPNVPYVMYLESDQVPAAKGYGLHGTYWHNDFGNPRSHGCVNLPTTIAKELYYWVSPEILSGKSSVYANDTNQGTRVVIHE